MVATEISHVVAIDIVIAIVIVIALLVVVLVLIVIVRAMITSHNHGATPSGTSKSLVRVLVS